MRAATRPATRTPLPGPLPSGYHAPMQLILLRHGIAVDRSQNIDDAQRALTDVGVKKTSRAMAGLAKLIDAPAAIITSPKLRARQTADLAAAVFQCPVQSDEALADGSAQHIIESLAGRNEQRLIAVGHEPTFSQVVEMLCFGRTTSSIELKKAGCACIQTSSRLTPGGASLQWLATPKMLRKLGK